MKHTMAVAVPNALQKLEHELAHDIGTQSHLLQRGTSIVRERLSTAAIADRQGLHEFLEIEIQVLEDEVEFMAVGVHDVEKLHNAGVDHFLEQRDFANGSAGHALVFGFETYLLEGNYAVVWRSEVSGLVDYTVRAFREGGGKLASGTPGVTPLVTIMSQLTLANLLHLLVVLHIVG
jgi:hypothetical protein